MQKGIEEKIIDYLTVLILGDKPFTTNPHCRVRAAWLRAKSIYMRMSEDEKVVLAQKINGTDGGT